MRNFILILSGAFFGAVVSILAMAYIDSNQDMYEEIFDSSLSRSEVYELANRFFEQDQEEFRRTLLCEVAERELRLRELVSNAKRSGLDLKGVYGGDDSIRTNSDFIFKKAGIDKESYIENYREICLDDG